MRIIYFFLAFLLLISCDSEKVNETKNSRLLEDTPENTEVLIPVWAPLAVAIVSGIAEGIDDHQKKKYNKRLSRKLEHITNLLLDIQNSLSGIEKTLKAVEENTLKIIDQNDNIIEYQIEILKRLDRIERFLIDMNDNIELQIVGAKLDDGYKNLDIKIEVFQKDKNSFYKDPETLIKLKADYDESLMKEVRPEKFIYIIKFSEFLNVVDKEREDDNFYSRKFIDFYFAKKTFFDTTFFQSKIASSLYSLNEIIVNNSNGNISEMILKHNYKEVIDKKNVRILSLSVNTNKLGSNELIKEIIGEYNYILNNAETCAFIKKVVLPDIIEYRDLCISRNNFALSKYYIEKQHNN